MSAAPAARALDFVVIGAAKSATTTMWAGLSSHPELCLPGDKERGFFNSAERWERGLDAYVAEAFEHAAPGQRIGTVTPAYMAGAGLQAVVARMRSRIPDARLVAILRDPVDRAVSRFRQALRQGTACGATFDEHVGAAGPGDEDVLADGEYGRILGAYLDAFPREQLHVLFTEDFDRWPATSYRRVFRHLGVDAGHVPDLDVPLNRGGLRPRASAEEVERILEHLREQVWPHVRAGREPQRALEWWVRHLWNIEADDAGRAVSDPLRRRLQERYLADAERLRRLTGLEPPWVAEYEFALGRGAHRIAA